MVYLADVVWCLSARSIWPATSCAIHERIVEFRLRNREGSITLIDCGNKAWMCFQPRSDKPVYDSDCYQVRSSGDRNNPGKGW